MDDLKFDVKAIARITRCSVRELAERTGISYAHLSQVSAGNVAMTFKDAQKLSDFSNIPLTQIVEVEK